MKPVNLLPQEQRAHTGGSRPGSAYAVVGALAVAVLVALTYVLTVNGINSKRSEIARMEAETQAAEQRAQALAPFTAFAGVRQTRSASVTSLAQARNDWERLMREVSRVLPASAYVTSFDAASAPAQTAAAPGAGAGGPTLKLTGCARDHRDVATVLVRLRKLHRAQDVKLRDSARSGAGAGAACTRGASFTAEVAFAPTAAAPEAPRGSDRVPASLGGGS